MSEILGVLFAIFVGIMVIPKFADYQTASNNNTRAAVTAQQQKQLDAAATTYIQQNSVAIQAIATPTTPAVITVAMLQAAGVNLLPAAFSATNPYGQTWQIEVLEIPTDGSGNLQALAMSTGGTTLTDAQATKISTIVGATGGFIPQNDSGIYPGAASNAYGSFAGWTIPTANYTGVTGGHLAALLTFNNGQLQSNYLYRNAVPGQTQLNTMNTPLIMASTQTTGSVCTTTGAIARDSAGAVVTCQGGTWKGGSAGLTWKGNVASIAALPASGMAGGDTYRVTGLANHAFVWDAQSSVWQGLVVNASGNLSLPGLIYTAGSSSNYGAVTMQGSKNGYSGINFKDSAGSSAGTLMMHPSYSGFYNAADNNWRMYMDNAGNVTLGDQSGPDGSMKGTINPGWAVETWGCSPNGAIAKAAYDTTNGWAYTGLTLSCQSGVWAKAGGTAATTDPTTGYPLNYCNASGFTASFKRISGVVYSRLLYQTSSSGWVVGAASIAGYPYLAQQYSGNLYGLYWTSGAIWQCFAYVP